MGEKRSLRVHRKARIFIFIFGLYLTETAETNGLSCLKRRAAFRLLFRINVFTL